MNAMLQPPLRHRSEYNLRYNFGIKDYIFNPNGSGFLQAVQLRLMSQVYVLRLTGLPGELHVPRDKPIDTSPKKSIILKPN